MVNIVLELALIDEVMALAAQSLHTSMLVHLPEGCLCVILTDAKIVVHWAVRRRVTDDVLCVEHAELVPLLEAVGEVLPIMQGWNKSWIVLWRRLEFINQFLG